MCNLCGLPSYVNCNCIPVSAQPFCDQCEENTNCTSITDSQCVIYHFAYPGYVPPPTKLINMEMPNGSSAEAIFEKIDTLFGAAFFRPWITGSTNTLNLHLDGPGLPVVLKGDVLISASAGNTLIANSDGLFAPSFNPDYKVKVDATAPPRYLADSLVGGTDGCVSISIIDQAGLLAIIPILDLACFADKICNSTGSIKAELGSCLLNSSLSVLDTSSIDLSLIPVGSGLQLSANSKISASAGNNIVINVDGLFVPTSTITINNNADNRLLTANGSTTSIDAEPTLLYNAGTLNAPLFNYNFQVVASQEFYRSLFVSQVTLNDANYGVKVSNITGQGSQLFVNSQVNTTFGRGHFLGGFGSELVLNSVGGTTTTGLVSSVMAKVDVFNTDNYTEVAALRTQYPSTAAVLGGVYSGTITNYYAVFIADTNGDEGGIAHTNVTNSYAIFQEGSFLKNSFATAVVVTSDGRVKTNIENYTKGLIEIENIRPVKYNFKENLEVNKIGVIAQEVEQVIPEAIETSKNDYYKIDDFKKLDNDVLVYTMINAIKELSSLNKALNDRLIILENKLK